MSRTTINRDYLPTLTRNEQARNAAAQENSAPSVFMMALGTVVVLGGLYVITCFMLGMSPV
ncbi:MAG: hypothetical protein ACRDD9_20025 [Shewanella sp.]